MELSESVRYIARASRLRKGIPGTARVHTSTRTFSSSVYRADESRPPPRPRTSIADLLSDPSRSGTESQSQSQSRRSPQPQSKQEINDKLSAGLANLLGRARRDPKQNRFVRQPVAPNNVATGKTLIDATVNEKSQEKPQPRSAIEALDTAAIYGSTGLLSRSFSRPDAPAPLRGFSATDSTSLLNSILSAGGGGRVPSLLRRPEIHLRLKPTLGKSVTIVPENNFNLTRAFQALETKINKNGNAVRRDERDQKFHLRRGMRVKMERRERWRALFQEGFTAEVGRVRRMISQGW